MSIILKTMKGVMAKPVRNYLLATRNLKGMPRYQQAQPVVKSVQTEENVDKELPDPLIYPDFFELHNLFTVKDLFDARVHYGHTMGTLNEHMKHFVLGDRLGTLIFDLDETAELLKQALNFIAHIAFRGGIIMFIARYKQNAYLIERTAMECGEYCHTKEWSLGTFTDPNRFGMMTRLPDLIIFLNTLDSVFEIHKAVLESNKLLIPSVGIVDTNCFPNYITYPIPGNDDSPQSIELYCRLFKEAILRGKTRRKEFIEKYSHAIEEK